MAATATSEEPQPHSSMSPTVAPEAAGTNLIEEDLAIVTDTKDKRPDNTASPPFGGGGGTPGDTDAANTPMSPNSSTISTTTTIVSIDDIPVSILYFAIGFVVVIVAAILSLIFQAVALLLDLVLALVVPLSIGCVLILQDALQYYIPLSMQQWEHTHGTKLLAVVSVGVPLLSSWIGIKKVVFLWIVKSFIVIAIVSRRCFRLVQHLQRHKELPQVLLQLVRVKSCQELLQLFRQQPCLVDSCVVLISIGLEMTFFWTTPSPTAAIITLGWYSLASLCGAVVALCRGWWHLQNKWSSSNNNNVQQKSADEDVDDSDHSTTMLLLPAKDGDV